MLLRRLALLLLAVLLVAACGRVGMPGPGRGNAGTAALVENRVWLEQDAATPGSFRAFVADGTLIAGSCAGPARLGAWRWVDDATLVWEEAGRTTRAQVGMVGRRELVLLPEPADEAPSLSFRAAQTPLEC